MSLTAPRGFGGVITAIAHGSLILLTMDKILITLGR